MAQVNIAQHLKNLKSDVEITFWYREPLTPDIQTRNSGTCYLWEALIFLFPKIEDFYKIDLLDGLHIYYKGCDIPLLGRRPPKGILDYSGCVEHMISSIVNADTRRFERRSGELDDVWLSCKK